MGGQLALASSVSLSKRFLILVAFSSPSKKRAISSSFPTLGEGSRIRRSFSERARLEVGFNLVSPSRSGIRGGGNCAYLNDNGLSSSRCSTERSWVCTKSLVPGPRERTRASRNLCVDS